MAMVDVDGSSHLSADSAQVCWLGLRVGSHLALSLHSSNEPGELSQWPWSWWQHHKHCRWIIIINTAANYRQNWHTFSV